jgi:MarR-like DNA-binding transcriptional regulator SgrR of sgrS sRNA
VTPDVEDAPRGEAYARYVLKSPYAEFAQLAGGSFQAKIAPRDVADLNKNPTGTGAFKLTELAGDP